MAGNKLYLKKDVLTAVRERISTIFDMYENIVVSVSGGKDSTAMFELAYEESQRRERKINTFFLDQEAEYQSTIDQIKRIMGRDGVKDHWYQVPIYLTNSTSYVEDMLYAWGPDENWMRDKDPIAIHSLDKEYPERFYKFIKWFEQQWPSDTTCFLVGLRAEESLNRFRAVTRSPGIKGLNWTTEDDGIMKAYPLYDWTFEDVWIYMANNNIEYNKLYDFLYSRGLKIQEARVSNLIHEKAFKCLEHLPEFEPETYNKLIERLSGVHVAARYAKKAMIYNNKKLPDNYDNWKEYRDFLLETSPTKKKEKFLKRFENQPAEEYIYKQQVRQLLLNDWENNISIQKRDKKKKNKKLKKWREIL